MSFKDLISNELILNNLTHLNYSTPSPIQRKCIPLITKGVDLIGIAQTGTGKTAAFSLPIIERLLVKDKINNTPKCLIVAPTRELANQINDSILNYAKNSQIRSINLIGGVSKDNQIEVLEKGIDFVVGTPGRLIDLIENKYLDLNCIEHFILDEADMMLDMGFLQDIKKLNNYLNKEKQTILFSATMPKEIETLAKSILNRPQKIEVTPQSSTIESINQTLYFVNDEQKLLLLKNIIENNNIQKAIIFCKAKYAVANVVEFLDSINIETRQIHSNITQVQREQSLLDFTEGRVRFLVATEIASRGIDVNDIDHVINFNIPEDPTNYVHRIGRTARAGKSGNAISLCSSKELALVRNIESLIKKTIPRISDQPFHQDLVIPVKKKNSSRRRSRKHQADKRKKH
ncbi:DEAD/DEAH box helicase [Halobacteriovorax sp. HLS]|uniref:DEAD/DEAH box helicase n=1 Tax=Halobacteriovorax sp. HLS TaxID=2234000 RepID=UPI000FD7B386|nr:DEAD/DEAH box helicase [Halobacteriovorax sp. HLS]